MGQRSSRHRAVSERSLRSLRNSGASTASKEAFKEAAPSAWDRVLRRPSSSVSSKHFAKTKLPTGRGRFVMLRAVRLQVQMVV